MTTTIDGRRLSFPRLGLLVAGIVLAVFVAMSGWHWFQDTKAAAASGQWFAGYADATVTPLLEFEEPASPAARDVVLSFVVASSDTPCEPSWGAAYSLDAAASELDLDRRIARLRQNDGTATVSFGGAINDELAIVCDDPDRLLNAYREVVERYELRTIDLDIEGAALADTAANARRAAAVKRLQDEQAAHDHDLQVWLTLPVSPEGLTDDGQAAVTAMLDADVNLSGVNVMTMDFGGGRAEDQSMIDATKDALEATHHQLGTIYARSGPRLGPATVWKRMGATPMIGQNDVPGEVFTLDDARELSAFATAQGLGRLSMWSLNRDRTCGANYPDVTTVSNSCSGVDQGDETFATILLQGLTETPAPTVTTPTPTSTATPAEVTDDPATSPYPIWAEDETYVEGTRVVWHHNAYLAKWWTLGDVPDDPVVDQASSPWHLIGPVLPGETPIPQPTLPTGTYPTWDPDAIYRRDERVLLDGVGFSAKWYSQGVSPDAPPTQSDPSPWRQLTDAEIRKVIDAED